MVISIFLIALVFKRRIDLFLFIKFRLSYASRELMECYKEAVCFGTLGIVVPSNIAEYRGKEGPDFHFWVGS